MTVSSNGRGVTLVELAVVIAIIAMIAGMVPMVNSTADAMKRGTTSKKLDTIEQALMAYRTAYNRLPCPADPTLAATNASYGYEAGAAGTCTGGAIQVDATHAVAEGAVPVKQLGLPAEYMYDAWGHKITYAVNQNVTAAQAMSGQALNEGCGITVTDAGGGNRTTGAVYALVAYGQDGHGSYDVGGNRINAGSTNTGEQTNCHCNASAAETTYAASYVEKARTEDSTSSKNLFDDQVRFKERWQMLTPDDMYATGGGPVCSTGLRFDDQTAGDEAGWSVAVGDVNGDGIPDLVIGVPSATLAGHTYSGSVYVILGRKSGWPADPIALATGGGNIIDGVNGFRFDGRRSYDTTGSYVAIGNVSAHTDGTNDIIIGAMANGGGLYPGSVYVIRGTTTPSSTWSATQTLNVGTGTILDGVKGFELDGETLGDVFGASMAVGDVNGDGTKDLVVGANYANPGGYAYPNGSTYVIYGKSNILPSTTVSTTSGSKTATVASYSGMVVGQTVAATGIPAATTISDCGVGGNPAVGTACVSTTLTLSANATATAAGSALTVASTPVGCNFLSSVACTGSGVNASGNAANGIRFDGPASGVGIGVSVAAGDVNGDGKADVIMGGISNDFNYACGAAFVVYGRAAGTWVTTPQVVDTAFLAGGGTAVNGTELGPNCYANSEYFGASIAVGDIKGHGNGIVDIVIGGAEAKNTSVQGGSTYVVYGSATPAWSTQQRLNCSYLTNGGSNSSSTCTGTAAVNGFRLDGEANGDVTGTGVAVCDVNGDGYADIVTIGYGVPGNSSASSTYVIFGGPTEKNGTAWAGSQTIDSSFLNSGSNGARFDGDATYNNFHWGMAEAGCGDITGDGKGEILIGAQRASPNGKSQAGSVYAIYGKKAGWSTPITLNTWIH